MMQTQTVLPQAPTTNAPPSASFISSVTEAPSKEEGWSVRHVVGETAVLTILAAILYAWGYLFHGAYIQEYGFPLSQVQIPLFEILFVTWAQVVLSAAIVAGLAALWLGRPFVLVGLWWVLKAIFVGVGLVATLVLRFTRLEGFLRRFFALLARGFEWTRNRTPKPLLEELERFDGKGAPRVVAAVYAPILFVLGAAIAANSGTKAARRDMSHAKEVSIVCEGSEEPITGRLVGALGDAVILDRQTGDRIQRTLLPTTRIRSTRQMIPEGEIVRTKAPQESPNVPSRPAPAQPRTN